MNGEKCPYAASLACQNSTPKLRSSRPRGYAKTADTNDTEVERGQRMKTEIELRTGRKARGYASGESGKL